MSAIFVRGDRRSADFTMFQNWRGEVVRLISEFSEYQPNYRPFHENELAGVSLLASAAARVGYTPVAESNLWKLAAKDRRAWASNRGRSDLWMLARGCAYSFEFKMSWVDSSPDDLDFCMSLARSDIRRVPRIEYDRAYAGLIAPVANADAVPHHRAFDPGGYSFSVMQDDDQGVFFYFDRWK